MDLSRAAWTIVLFATVNGLIAQVLESYSAHGLTEIAGEYAATVFHMSAKYQMWHVLALLFIGLILDRIADPATKRLMVVTSVLFALGMAAFSGGMYWVPFGGNVYMAVGGAILLQMGWFAFVVASAMAVWRAKAPAIGSNR
ncbi:MAG: DUF423 domain-containing protein [Rhodospirillaceae bacterium]|nr:DUF423 domain-containing protein [Rhodospirillaceae bacterium]